MSKVSITGNNSGTGTFTVAAPDSNNNRTFNLPDEDGVVLTDSTDLEPQVKTSLNATGDAPLFACRAFVNFDGTGTVAIRESGNVSSITDRGNGQYTVNFTAEMEDADYSVTGASSLISGRGAVFCVDSTVSTPLLTNSCSILTHQITTSNSYVDTEIILLSIFR